MLPRVLFIITSDPRRSARAAEAVRIAAGIASSGRLLAEVYLRDAAVLMLGPDAEELIDGDHFIRYLPLVAQEGGNVYSQGNAPLLPDRTASSVPHESIDDVQLASLVAESRQVLRF
jgi:hypothetical protein